MFFKLFLEDLNNQLLHKDLFCVFSFSSSFFFLLICFRNLWKNFVFGSALKVNSINFVLTLNFFDFFFLLKFFESLLLYDGFNSK